VTGAAKPFYEEFRPGATAVPSMGGILWTPCTRVDPFDSKWRLLRRRMQKSRGAIGVSLELDAMQTTSGTADGEADVKIIFDMPARTGVTS